MFIRRKRSTTDHVFCIRQILEKKWEYSEALHKLFLDFKKAYDSVRREVLHNILMEFRVPLKRLRLIKMCLTETCTRVRACKHLSDMFPINPLTPNDPYSGRTARLTSKRCILYIYSTNIGTEYFKNGINSLFFFSLFKMQFVS